MLRNVTVLLIILAGVVVAAILYLTRQRPVQESHVEMGPLVEIVTAQDKTVTMIVEGFGTVRAKTELTASAEVSGKITLMSPKLEEGMFFKKGQLLLEIDPRSFELMVRQLRARIEQHKAELLRIEQERKNNEKNLKIAAEDLELALKAWERQKNLQVTNVASDIAVEAAKIRYLQSKSNKQSIENALAVLVPQKAAAEAQLSMAKVELEDAELNLSKTRLHAAFDGRTAEKLVEAGQFVTVGTPLVQIYDTSAFEVEVQLPSEDMRWLDLSAVLKMREKDSAESDIAGKNFPVAMAHFEQREDNFTWKGVVARVGGVVERATRTIPIITEFSSPWESFQPGKSPLLVPGMFVRVEIVGRSIDNVFELPRSAIRPATTVYIADQGLLRIRPVHLLRTIGNKAYIDKGIMPGEQVIISPLSTVTERMKIRTSSEASEQ